MTLSIPKAGQTAFIPTDLVGTEEVCSPGTWTIQAAVATDQLKDAAVADIIDTLIGAQASLTLDFGDDAGLRRHVHGVVCMAEWLGTDAQSGSDGNQDRFHRYRLELRSSAALLGLTTRSRVLQQQTAIDIATSIIAKHQPALGLEVVDACHGGEGKAVLEYVVQYGESDLDFMTRILAEAGLYWAIVHGTANAKLVIGSGPNSFSDISGDDGPRVVNFAPAGSCKATPFGGHVEAVVCAAPRRSIVNGWAERPALRLSRRRHDARHAGGLAAYLLRADTQGRPRSPGSW